MDDPLERINSRIKELSSLLSDLPLPWWMFRQGKEWVAEMKSLEAVREELLRGDSEGG